MKLTDAERRALSTMVRASPRWVWSGHFTDDKYATVHGATVRRLERRGLAKSRAELPWGKVVRGADLGRWFGQWSSRWTITALGRRVLGKHQT